MSSLPRVQRTLTIAKSPVSGEICVVQDGEERRLVVGGLTQSINADAPDVEGRIWGELVGSLTANRKSQIENALILGLGGGTVAHLLTKKYGAIPIDAVELDPMVVEVGKKFFDLDQLSNLKIISADAVDVVKNPTDYSLFTNHYSLIIVDLYIGSRYPSEAESSSFFAGLTRLLNPKGLLVFNRLSTKKDSEFEEKLEESFGQFEKKLVPSKFGGTNLIFQTFPNQKQRGGDEG